MDPTTLERTVIAVVVILIPQNQLLFSIINPTYPVIKGNQILAAEKENPIYEALLG